jgi:hypothetical protein
MFESHEIFESPKNEDQIIWRYLDFTKFVDLLNTSSLFFTRADYFEDIFEGSITKRGAELRNNDMAELIRLGKLKPQFNDEFWRSRMNNQRKDYAINCWHMNDYESAAMWKLYLKSNEGIAIQSTYSHFKECFSDSTIPVYIGIVKYIDYETDFFPWNNVMYPFVHKRKSFEHEKELRAVIWEKQNPGSVSLDSGGIKIKIDLKRLIDKVFVSPDSPSWLTQLVQDVSQKYEMEISVINSRLKDSPIF